MSGDVMDGDDPTVIDFGPRIAAAIVPYRVIDGCPVNPMFGTGRNGRGELWLWGENPAVDAIVVADTPTGRRVLLICRDDGGGWAIPGGMVNPGEQVKDALARELLEETGVDLCSVEPQILTRTYVNDPRNTDHAWICSTVALYRIDHEPQETAGDDAAAAGWFKFDSLPDLVENVRWRTGGELYQAHEPLLDEALDALYRPPTAGTELTWAALTVARSLAGALTSAAAYIQHRPEDTAALMAAIIADLGEAERVMLLHLAHHRPAAQVAEDVR